MMNTNTNQVLTKTAALKAELKGKKNTKALLHNIEAFEDLYVKRLSGENVSFKAIMQYLITWKMNGKMETMISLSTSCLENKYCEAYSKNPSFICKDCYAKKELKLYKSLRYKAAFSTIVLCNVELLPDDVPLITNRFFRFEAFGDLQTALQFKNYNLFCRVNEFSNCTLWTKNPFIIQEAINEYELEIAANFKIIYSIPEIDRKITAYDKKILLNKYPFIAYFFAVYSSNNSRTEENGYICKMKCSECKYFCYQHKAVQGTLIQEIKKGNENK